MEENVVLLSVEVPESDDNYEAKFALNGRVVKVLLTTKDGLIYTGHTDEICGDRFGADITFLGIVATGYYYNRILTIQDDCGEWGRAWQVLDDTRSSHQEIRDIDII